MQEKLGHQELNNQDTVQYRSYSAGSTIITQGDASTDAYSLIEGRAIAIQDGQRIGEISQGELFGAIAAFTGSKRKATVVAASDCVVRVMAQATFMDLVKKKPEICSSIK